MKTIAVGPVISVIGRPLRLPKRDEDGQLVWKDPEKTDLETEPATAVNLIKQIILSLPQQLQAPSDSLRATRIWAQIEGLQNGHLQLQDQEYDWLHRVLNRQMPRSKDEKEASLEPQTLMVKLFGLNAHPIKRALTDVDVKAPP